MVGDRDRLLNWQRCEAKYLISEFQAAEISRYCRDHLPPDPHVKLRAGCAYPILSTYLDSASRVLLRHTMEKQTNRYKLRVRCYRSFAVPPDGSPEFMEIKRKIGDVVHKTRAELPEADCDALLWSDTTMWTGDGGLDRATEANVREFLRLRSRIGARPVVGVYYMREAYEGISAEKVRVTLDRDLHYGALARPRDGGRDMWWPINAGGVVLEVKFTNVYPFWVRDMLRRVEVVRCGVCKYVLCSRGAGIAPGGS